MTEGNTIDFLYYIRCRVVTERDKYHAVPQAYKFFQDRVDMCDMAIDSLNSKSEAEESRTPRTPMYKMVYGKRLLSEAYCPECGDTVFRNDNYCSKCGQAIDWTEIEE